MEVGIVPKFDVGDILQKDVGDVPKKAINGAGDTTEFGISDPPNLTVGSVP